MMREIFEVLMRAKGHPDLELKNNRYVNASIQTRWNYFQLGWEMRGATK